MASNDPETSFSDDSRIAAITQSGDSRTLGACLYLTPEDLESLGVDPSADAIRFSVDESTGQLEVEEVLEKR